MEKSQPIVIIAENQSSVWSGSVELFNAQNIVGGGEYDKTGETIILTEKYKNQSTLPVQQDSQYGGNPYVQFDIGDDGATFETGNLVTIKVNGEDRKGIVKEYDDGNGNIIRGFGNPYLFNSTLYQDNGLDYFAFYEGEEEGQYISGTINDGSNTFAFNINGNEVTADVDENGNWRYDISEDTTITSFATAFYSKSNLETIDLSHVDSSQVTTMQAMFYGCDSLMNITFGNFSTESCQNMNLMFEGCNALEELDLSSFNTHNVTNMSNMFSDCYALKNLTFGETFDTSNVTTFEYMFRECGFETLDISVFNTISAENMQGMFTDCTSLKNLMTGSGFTTENVVSMGNMFYNCFDNYFPKSLIEGFNTENVVSMGGMFNGCSQPTGTLDLSNWDVSKVRQLWKAFESWTGSDLVLNLSNWDLTNYGGSAYIFNYNATYTIIKTSGLWNEDITEEYPNINWQNA